MAVLSTALPTGYSTALAADKPLLLSKNVLESGSALDVTAGSGPETISACWRSVSGVGSATPINVTGVGASNSDPWQNPTRIYDRKIYSPAAPRLAATTGSDSFTRHHLIARIPANSSDDRIDSVIICGHNLAELADYIPTATLTVTVFLSDTSSFSSYTQFAQFVITGANKTPARLVHLDSVGYYNVEYVQVVFSVGSGLEKLPAPQISEIFLGPRRQLSRRPSQETDVLGEEPTSFANIETENSISTFVAKSGATTRYAISRGRELLNPTFAPSGDSEQSTTDLYSMNDSATLEQSWVDSSYGAKPVFYIPYPNSDPNRAYFVYKERQEFNSSVISGLTDREVEYDFREIAPYVGSEV